MRALKVTVRKSQPELRLSKKPSFWLSKVLTPSKGRNDRFWPEIGTHKDEERDGGDSSAGST